MVCKCRRMHAITLDAFTVCQSIVSWLTSPAKGQGSVRYAQAAVAAAALTNISLDKSIVLIQTLLREQLCSGLNTMSLCTSLIHANRQYRHIKNKRHQRFEKYDVCYDVCHVKLMTTWVGWKPGGGAPRFFIIAAGEMLTTNLLNSAQGGRSD